MSEAKNKAIRSIREYGRRFDTAKDRHRGLLGDGAGNIAVDGREGRVYYRRRDAGLAAGVIDADIVTCTLANIPFVDGLPIIVGQDGISGDEVVLGRDIDSLVEGIYEWVKNHHEQHEFQNILGGFDVTWIQKPQIVPLLGAPTAPASMQIWVYREFFLWADGWKWWRGGLSDDMTPHLPAAGQARFALVSLDGATNTLQTTLGDAYPIVVPAPRPDTVIPTPPAGSLPIVAIYLTNGLASIPWDNLYDVRMFVQPMGGSLTSVFDDTEGDPTDVDLSGPTDGVSVYASRRDHRHDLDPDMVLNAPQYAGSLLVSAPVSLSGDCALSGDCFSGNCWVEFDLSGNGSGTFLRNDGTQPYWGEIEAGDVGDIGGVPNLTYGLVNAGGAAATYVRTDASLAIFDAVNPTTIQCDDAAAPGAAAFAARRDHKHAIVCAAPGSPSVDLAASAEGVATSFARSDHTHQLDESIAPTWTDVHLFQDLALNTVVSRYVIEIDYIKTLGVTDAADDMAGIYSKFELDQVGGTIGNFYGAYVEAQIDDGTVGAGKDMWGIYTLLDLNGGTLSQNAWGLQAEVDSSGTAVAIDIWGIDSWIDLNTGSVGGDVIGVSTWIDIAAGYDPPGSDVFGFYAYVDVDSDPTGDVYMLYLDEQNGIDYGIYQSGTADNYLGGNLGVGRVPLYHLDVYETAINIVGTYRGISSYHSITAQTNPDQDAYGLYSQIIYNDADGQMDDLYGCYTYGLFTSGAGENVFGMYLYARAQAAAVLSANIRGTYVRSLTDDGSSVAGDQYGLEVVTTVTGDIGDDVFGIDVYLDANAAGDVTGDLFGVHIEVDNDLGVHGGTAYALYVWGRSHVDYGIYQTGGDKNYFSSFTGFGAVAPGARLEVNGDASDDPLTILDSISDVDAAFIKFKGVAAAADITRSIIAVGDISGASSEGWLKTYVQDDGNRVTDAYYYIPFYTIT